MAIFNTPFKRPRYFDRQQLAAEDLALAQTEHIRRTQQLNRHLHGWGVVCGALLDQRDARVNLTEGFAITPSGNNLYIPMLADLDLEALIAEACGELHGDCEDQIPEQPSSTRAPDAPTTSRELPERLYLTARRVEVETDPQPRVPADCGHPGNSLAYSRTCEAVCVELICELPTLHRSPALPCDVLHDLFCNRTDPDLDVGDLLQQYFACPSAVATEEDFVVLATLELVTEDERRVLQSFTVQYDDRRLLLPTQTLQQYLSCLCNRPEPTPSPTVTPSATRVPTPTPTSTFTFSPRPTLTLSRQPTLSVTRVPTRVPTLTFSREPTLSFTREPTLTFTQLPTDLPTFGPGGVLTRPVDPLLLEGIDNRIFNPLLGDLTPVGDLELLSDGQSDALNESGIDSLLDLFITDTPMVADTLGVSEVRAAEVRENALERMRRNAPLVLDEDEFDVASGMRADVTDVRNIGRVRGARLTAAGLASVADMANATPQTLGEVLSVSPPVANGFITDAQNRIRRQ